MEENEKWIVDNSIPPLPLQDPFVTQVNGEFIVGGVEVFDDVENPGMLNYRTNFYRGNSLRSLTLFAKGPDRMKDIRLLQLEKKSDSCHDKTAKEVFLQMVNVMKLAEEK